MNVEAKKPSTWVGPSLIAIGTLHTLVMVVSFWNEYLTLISSGLFNTLNLEADPMLAVAFWALQFGGLLILIGLQMPSTRSPVSWAFRTLFFLVVVMGIIIMPSGGFWLALPACIAVAIRG